MGVSHPVTARCCELSAGKTQVSKITEMTDYGLPTSDADKRSLISSASAATSRHISATDWSQIAQLYRTLARVAPSPVVELNRAVAVAMADGPAAGLALVEALAETGELDGNHLLHATRADLLRRLGRHAEAASCYRQALALVGNDTEREFLSTRL